jgi:hypothetical protein
VRAHGLGLTVTFIWPSDFTTSASGEHGGIGGAQENVTRLKDAGRPGGVVGQVGGVGAVPHASCATALYPASPFGCTGAAVVWNGTPEQVHKTKNPFGFPGAGSGRKS